MPNLSPPPAFIAQQDWWPVNDQDWINFKNAPSQHKQLVEKIRETFTDAFRKGTAISEIVIGHAITIDYLLWYAWFSHDLHKSNATLIAVGGYGRAELHIYSDIDLLVLVDKNLKGELKEKLSSFLTFLWDSGLDIGHSVRTVKQTVEEAKRDITVITSIVEARALCGNISLFNKLKKAIDAKKIWDSQKYYQAKKEELIARHKKYGDTSYQLEPNIKEGPGGIRDIQFIDWVTKRHYGNRFIGELINTGFITEEEYNQLRFNQEYLWKIRCALHIVTRRKEERLLFNHQIELARESGYNNLDSNLAVEQFMQNYYRHISECRQLTELLMQHFEETCLKSSGKKTEIILNSRFYSHNNVLYVTNKNTFRQYPMAMLELFLLMQQNEQITQVSSDTIRLIRQNLHVIDDNFRSDIRNRSLFIEILRQPRHITRELKRAHRYGVLAAYWPSFARIVGRMQYDLYHVYTVDHHILMVLQEARKFAQRDQCDAAYHAIFNQLPKPELLYLAALFHDIGKGRKGDHSSEGAKEAQEFCLAHGLSEFDAKLVAWLAQNHLEMSIIAQQQDISDPAVINAFAEKTSTLIRLNYLYLLTIADINGTNPSLWNNWRATLLAELYRSTAAQLQLETPKDSDQLVAELQASALHLLEQQGHNKQLCLAFWEELDNDYFLHHTDDEIAWHTHAVLDGNNELEPQIHIRQLTSRGCTAIFIYSRDRQHLFPNVTHCLHRLGLSILDARIITTKKGNALDTFVVLNKEGAPVSDQATCDKIEKQLHSIFQPSYQQENSVSQYISRRLLHFSSKPDIKIINEADAKQSCLHVRFIDYPGLLSHIADVFADLDIKVHSARVSTLGERAHDIFYITTSNDKIISDASLEKTIIQHISDRLTQETKQNNTARNI